MCLEREGGNEKDGTAPCPRASRSPVRRVAEARGHLDACPVGLCNQPKVPQPCMIGFLQRYTGSASPSLLDFLATPYEGQHEGMLK